MTIAIVLTLQEVQLKYNYYCEVNTIAIPLRFSWLKQSIVFKAGDQKRGSIQTIFCMTEYLFCTTLTET